MDRTTAIFGLTGIACYAVAFFTSYVLVRWILPLRFTQSLGDNSRFVAIDGIRGGLAFSVFLHHCIVGWMYLQSGIWSAPPAVFQNELGQSPVAIFFMITAFLFWGRVSAAETYDWRTFAISRIFRIVPLYLLAVFVVVFVAFYKTRWTFAEPAAQIAKEIVSWLAFRYPDINGYAGTSFVIARVNWTLIYESWFYLSLPLLVLIFLRRNSYFLKLAALAVVVALLWVNGLGLHRAAAFLGGIAAVYWIRNPARAAWGKSTAAALLAAACAAYVFFFQFDGFANLSIVLLTIFFAAIASGNTLFGLLKTRSAMWLGEISYSIYLLHGIAVWTLLLHVFPRIPGFALTPAWLAIAMIAITPVVVLACSATYALIERPFIDFGHRLAVPPKVSGLSQRP